MRQPASSLGLQDFSEGMGIAAELQRGEKDCSRSRAGSSSTAAEKEALGSAPQRAPSAFGALDFLVTFLSRKK